MNVFLFKSAAKYLLPLLLLFSIFILLRGHYVPGGGFVGGLIASIAFVVYLLAHGLDKTKILLKYPPFFYIPVGLGIALISGLVPMFLGEPFLTVLWFEDPFPVVGSVGTALFFDIGVYLVVIGVTLTILFTISENV